LTNDNGDVNASLVNLMDKTSSLVTDNVFEEIDYPYIAGLMERMREDENSNVQKMTIFGIIMQNFETNFSAKSPSNTLTYEELHALLRIATSNKTCYFDHRLVFLRKCLDNLSEERSPNSKVLPQIWNTLDSLDSDSWTPTRQDLTLGKPNFLVLH
jgi:hypothetical protein